MTAPTTEGPFYFDPGRFRADIAEGRPGVRLAVRIQLLDGSGLPLPGMRIDIWHCDSAGRYSGYPGQGADRGQSTEGQTFLRGHQFTNAIGVAEFASIYPGWYEGRTTHIHFKVIDDARTLLTSQFFLPDALSEYLYTSVPSYRRARLRSTLNSNDGILIAAGDTVIGAVHERSAGYVATLTVAVERDRAGGSQRRPGDDRPRRGPPPGAGPGRWAPEHGEARVAAMVPGSGMR